MKQHYKKFLNETLKHVACIAQYKRTKKGFVQAATQFTQV